MNDSLYDDYSDDDNNESLEQVKWMNISFSVIICVVGLFGNITVIFVITVLKEYKKSITNWYVLQLAIADALFLISIPFNVVEYTKEAWPFSESFCRFKQMVLFLNYYASVLFLTIMSIDRYVAVCHGFNSKLSGYRTHNVARIIATLTWIVALILCIPIIISSNKVGHYPKCLCVHSFPDYNQICYDKGYTEDTLGECLAHYTHKSQNSDGSEQYCKRNADDQIEESFQDDNATFTTAGYSVYDVVEGSAFLDNASVTVTSPPPLEAVIASSDQPVEYSAKCNYRSMSRYWSMFLIFNFVAMFLLPFLAMVLCYLQIVMTFKRSRTRVRKMSSISRQSSRGNTSRPGQRRPRIHSGSTIKQNKVTLMCVLLVGSFGVLWLPFHAFHLAKLHGIPLTVDNEDVCESMQLIVSILVYLNSALNPFLYSGWGSKFREKLKLATESTRLSVTSTRRSRRGIDLVKYSRRRDASSSFFATQMSDISRSVVTNQNSGITGQPASINLNIKAQTVKYNGDSTVAEITRGSSEEERGESKITLFKFDNSSDTGEGSELSIHAGETSPNNDSQEPEAPAICNSPDDTNGDNSGNETGKTTTTSPSDAQDFLSKTDTLLEYTVTSEAENESLLNTMT